VKSGFLGCLWNELRVCDEEMETVPGGWCCYVEAVSGIGNKIGTRIISKRCSELYKEVGAVMVRSESRLHAGDCD